jgi:VanZ family protein
MPPFTSPREKRLWLWVLLVTLAIFSTLGFSYKTTDALRDREFLTILVSLGFLLILASVLWHQLMNKPGEYQIWITLGLLSVALLTVLRWQSQETRTHILEYSMLAAFTLQALKERRANLVTFKRSPEIIALVVTIAIGMSDEVLQTFLPNRSFELQDLGIDAAAALLTVGSSQVADFVRKRWGKKSN